MFGLFDWIWSLLYGISKSMYAIIDKLLACANMLCGIEPITYGGQQMDFLTFLIRNQTITYAFGASALVGVFLVVIFGVFAILRTVATEKSDKTPAQIGISIAKTMLTFLFIPAMMVLLIFFTNLIMQVLYSATLGGTGAGVGTFLAGAFGQNALKSGVSSTFFLNPGFDYSSTSQMKKYVDLSDYDYFFSWLGSIVIILCLGTALLMFVDRAISLVVLFVIAPISMSTVVLDDGARFKLWRDQFLVKFLTGYGVIIAINIYALIIAAICNDKLVFFNNSILNYFMKILIIVGGGVSMNRVMALIGNLISAGAGSNELRDSALAASSFRRATLGVAGGALSKAFGATRSAFNFARDSKNTGLGTTIGRSLGFKTKRDYDLENARLNSGRMGSGGANHKSGGGGAGNKVSNAIGGPAKVGEKAGAGKGGPNVVNNVGDKGQGGAANNNVPGPGGNMVNNAINNALDKKDGDKK